MHRPMGCEKRESAWLTAVMDADPNQSEPPRVEVSPVLRLSMRTCEEAGRSGNDHSCSMGR